MFRLLRGALCVAASAAIAMAATCSHEEFCETYAFSAKGRIALENLNGDVRITTWDRPEVRVEAFTRGQRPDGARILVDSTESALSIRTRYDADAAAEPAAVEYRLTVPRTATLEDIRLVNGALSIVGLAGDVKATAINGSIDAQDLEGQADLSTINGKLDAAFFRICDARSISLRSVNGPITLSLPADAKASVDAHNKSGGIRSAYGRPQRVVGAGGHALRTNIKGGGARIKVNNVNGGISIKGPARHPREC
jgi:hypothetical protein